MCISVSDALIERDFSKADAKIPSSARNLLEATEADRMVVIRVDEGMLATNYKHIADVWMASFPSSRSGNFNRIDTCSFRHTPKNSDTGELPCERIFLKRRREDVARAVTPAVAPDTSATVISCCGLSMSDQRPNFHLFEGSFRHWSMLPKRVGSQ